MVVSLLFLLIGLSIGALATWAYWMARMRRHKIQMRQYALKVEELTANYDDYRRKYIDLDDRFRELQSQEQTYRVAYQEWKEKYNGLNDEYLRISESFGSINLDAKSRHEHGETDLSKIELEAELERVKEALSQTTARLDQQAEMIQLHNRQAERLDRLKGQLMELIDHGNEIAIKSDKVNRDPSDPRVTDL